MSEKITSDRREFMKVAGLGAGLGAAALSVAGLDVANASTPPPAKWDEETDVVVVGYGGAGANSAINAADAGAQVVILEKNPADLHVCNTNCSGGLFICANDAAKGFEYIKACIGDTVDDEMCRLWAEQTLQNPAYIKKLADAVGLPSDVVRWGGAEFPDVPGAEGITIWIMKHGPGAFLYQILDKNVKARRDKIRVDFSSPAKKVVQTGDGEVLGIIAERGGKEVAIRGRRATVLASGGYEYSDKMKLNSFLGNPRWFYGTDSNTGDGLAMAVAAGADLWHMNWSSQHYGFHYKDFPVGFNLGTPARQSYMVVDQSGKRFFDESYNGHSAYLYFCYFDPLLGAYPRIPSYFVFDESLRTGGAPLSPSKAPNDFVTTAKTAKYKYYWSDDQSAEIDRGWILKANTIDELVEAIRARQAPNKFVDYTSPVRMNGETLKATLTRFNQDAAQSKDSEFARKRLAPITKAPFYATEVWPVGPNTQGGPRFDAKGRVLDPYGKPIPRLYKCGELGSIYGQRYPGGGGNLSELLAFGRIVGENAAKEKA